MCRATSENGGRRCYAHTYGARLNRLRATIALKEEDLERANATKMKTAFVKRQIRDLEASLDKKRAYLADREDELVRVRKIVDDPDTHPTVKEGEIIVEKTRTEIKTIEGELKDLYEQAEQHPDSVKINRRIRDLENLVAEKKQKLSAVETEAAEAREEAERFKAEKPVPLVAPKKHVWDEADPATLGFSVGVADKEELTKRAGDMPVSEYVLQQSLTGTPVLSNRPAVFLPRDPKSQHADESRSLTVGRRNAENGIVRSEAVTIRATKRREVVAVVNAEIAEAYGLTPNDYMRRISLGKDLYAVDAWTGKKQNEKRLARIQTIEENAGITIDTPAEDVVKFRNEFFEQNRAEALQKARTKFGDETVDYVLSVHGGKTA